MSRSQAFLLWLENKSDWLNPIVVKEVRQLVRGREFNYSFSASLMLALAIAFFGAADALTGHGGSGRQTFAALMGCLALLGLAVVPIGAFSALRNERLEQTLELITLTALSPRRIVIGKLLAQAVKLATFFAAMAPFIAMCFLLGGIDFVTILISLFVLFVSSLWISAACLFLSTLLKSRAMSGFVFGGVGIVLFLVLGMGRSFYYISRYGPFGGGPFSGSAGSQTWWALTIATTFCVASMINLVLLAENRLSLATENRVTPLRVGFLVQFLLIAAWTLSFIHEPRTVSAAIAALGIFGGLHLAVVATFTVTEDLVLSRRALLGTTPSSPWRWFLALFRPGGGRGAAYVVVQMAILIAAAYPLIAAAAAAASHPSWMRLRWFLAICGYICFFTGVPALALRLLRPASNAALSLRVAILVLLSASLILPDIVHYVLWQPNVLDLGYSGRHLINPVRTLANWRTVELRQWFSIPFALGLTGLLAYLALMILGRRMSAQPAQIDAGRSTAAAREPGSASITY